MTDYIQMGQLRPGDLLFGYVADGQNRPGLGQGTTRGTHVSMVTEVMPVTVQRQLKTLHGSIPYTLDRVGVREVHEAQGRANRIYQNDLRPTLSAPVKAGKQEPAIRVMRCRRAALRNRAVKYAQRWRSYETPFATGRVAHAEVFEGQFGNAGALVSWHRRMFRESGKFRAIKYAARRKGPVCYPTEEGEKGMFCSMFVTTCYQVAGLKGIVGAPDPDPLLRVSDKRMRPTDIELMAEVTQKTNGTVSQSDLRDYFRYTQQLRSLSPYSLGDFEIEERFNRASWKPKRNPKLTYVPSLLLWDAPTSVEGFDWPAHITAGMQVDAKIIMPGGLFESLRADKAAWTDMGTLLGPWAYTEAPKDREARQIAEHGLALQLRNAWY